MKKLTALFMSVAMFASQLSVVRAEEELALNKVYADLNGISVTFSDDVSAITDFSGIQLSDVNNNTIETSCTAEGNDIFIKPVSDKLSAEELYSLNVSVDGCIENKIFKIEKVFEENFDSYADGTTANKIPGFSSGKNIVFDKMMMFGHNGGVGEKINDDSFSSLTDYTLTFNSYFYSLESGKPCPYFDLSLNENSGTAGLTNNFAIANNEIKIRGNGNNQAVYDNSLKEGTGILTDNTVSGGTYTVDTKAENKFKFDVRKSGNKISLYLNDNYKTSNTTDNNSGIIKLKAIDKFVLAVDDISITAYKEYQPANVTVDSITADNDNITLGFSGDVSSIVDFSDISLSDVSDNTIDFTAKTNGNNIVLTPNGGMELDKIYHIAVPENFGNIVCECTNSLDKYFKVASIVNENFDAFANDTKLDDVSDKFKTYVQHYGAVYNGKAYISKANLGIQNGIENYENYKATFDVYLYKRSGTTPYVNFYANADKAIASSSNFGLKLNGTKVQNVLNKSASDAITTDIFTAQNIGAADVTNGKLTITAEPAKAYKITLDKKGGSIGMYVDGTLIHTYAPENYDTKKGYFEINAEQYNAIGIDNLSITDFVECEKKDIAVTGIKGYTDRLEVAFDDSVAEVSDFSKIQITEGFEKINFTVEHGNDNVLIIRPNEEFTPDKAYGIVIEKGFGANLSATAADYSKKFKLATVFAENFANIEDGTKANSITGFNGAHSAVYGNKLYNLGGDTISIKEPKIAAAENYTFTFDVYFYTAQGQTASTIPYAGIYFNSNTTGEWSKGSYRFEIAKNNIKSRVTADGKTTDSETKTYDFDSSKYGVLALDSEGKNFANVVTESTPYTFRVEKEGNKAKFYINNEFVVESTETPETKGYINFKTEGTYCKAAIGNIRIAEYTELPASVEFADFTLTDANGQRIETKAELETLNTVKGSVSIRNYAEETKNIKILAAVYAVNGTMLSAKVINDADSIAQNEGKTFDYSFSGLTNPSCVKVFAIDSFSSLIPYTEAVAEPEK